MPGPDPAVAVGGEHRGAADPGSGERDALTVDERPEGAAGAAGEDAVARERTGAAAARGDEQVVVTAARDDVGALVAPADGHGSSGTAEPHRVAGDHETRCARIPRTEAAVVEHPAASRRCRRARRGRWSTRTSSPRRSGGAGPAGRRPSATARSGWRSSRRRSPGPSRSPAAAHRAHRVGHGIGQVVAAVGAGVDDVGRPEPRRPARPRRLARESGADVPPVHEVPAAEHRQPPVQRARRPGSCRWSTSGLEVQYMYQ